MAIQRIPAGDSDGLKLQLEEEATLSTGKSSLDERYENASELFAAVMKRAVDEGGLDSNFYSCSVNNLEAGVDTSFSLQSYAPLTAFPKDKRNQLLRVDYWTGNLSNIPSGDDLLNNLLKVKRDFTVLGLKLCPTGEDSTDDYSKFLGRMQVKWDFDKLVEDLLQDWFAKDTMVLYWKVSTGNESELPPPQNSKQALTPGLMDICTLNPAECDWDNSFGMDIMRYKIPKELQTKIRNAFTQGSKRASDAAIKALLDAGVEMKYIQAVKDGQEYVTLKKEDGDRWLVVTQERNTNYIAKPSMRFIFDALEARRFVKEGEFAASYMMKHFIFHATAGESITQGPLAGLKNNWAKKPDIDKLYAILKDTGKAQRIATNHTVKFNFVFPPKEIWGEEKYVKSEARILDFVGINVIVMTGTGGTNAGGYLGIKRMIAGMQIARKKISRLLFEFFDSPEIRKICNVPTDVDVTATFDENALKEPKQLLDELKFAVPGGLVDPPTAVSELGRNPNAIRKSKKNARKENSTDKTWEPVYVPVTQGTTGKRQVKQSDKGRPPNDGTTQSEETRQQSARASS